MKLTRYIGYAALAALLSAAPACTEGQSHADGGDTARTPHRDRPLPRDRRRRGPPLSKPTKGYFFYVNFRSTAALPCASGPAEPLTGCEVSPCGPGIAASVEGSEARFTPPGAGWWVVRLNDRDRLLLLADKPEKAPTADGQTLNAADFVSGDGLQTANLQRALDEASATGRTLIFPRGVYPTGTLRIGSNTHLYLADRGDYQRFGRPRRLPPPTAASPEADHIHNKKSTTPTTASG